MRDITSEVLAALLTAPHEAKEAALAVLQQKETAPPRPEPYITLAELGRQLNISTCSLWRWRIPGHELGGHRRYRFSEVDAYLNSDQQARRAKELTLERSAKRKQQQKGQ